MKMEELEGKSIKICKSSVTAKRPDGKTCGVVRNIRNINNIPASQRFPVWKKAVKSGIWEFSVETLIRDDNNEWWYINNTRTIHNYKKLVEICGECELTANEKKRYDLQNAVAKAAKEIGFHVINCEVLS